MTIRIPLSCEGRLLRSYLKLTLGLSSAVLARLKNNEHGILVNGRRVTVRYVLHAGDRLELADRDTIETATERVLPVELPLSVLYEDDTLIALNKPAAMPTHPSHGHLCDTLANALAYRYRLADEPFVFRPLGRLDRNTSGVVIVGKTRAAAGYLSRALQRGEVRKRYVAILVGELPSDGQTHTVTAPICRPDAAGIRRAVCSPDAPGAVTAETRYRTLITGGGHSLVLCEPITGRTHQLRVHFSHLGHPILGDDIYGDGTPSSYIDRHALHALMLSVPIPFFGAAETDTVDNMTSAVSPTAADAIGLSTATAPERPSGTVEPPVPPLNTATSDGYLHAWAPLPTDMRAAAVRLFGDAALTDATAMLMNPRTYP